MTIFELSVISTTGFPYLNLKIQESPKDTALFLRFYDFSKSFVYGDIEGDDHTSKFDLTAGLISALYEFAKTIDKRINILEFIPPQDDKEEDITNFNKCPKGMESDVLITVQTEKFLRNQAIYLKILLIYKLIISLKAPLDSADELLENEKELIVNILLDQEARNRVFDNESKLNEKGNAFLKEMIPYGLEALCICSFDFSPIVNISRKYKIIDINSILRNIGFIPEIAPMEWIYRQSYLTNDVWVYIIHSGTGPTVENTLFEPYFYILIAKPESYFGEFPRKVQNTFNKILQ